MKSHHLSLVLLLFGCGASASASAPDVPIEIAATIGPEGGTLQGPAGGPLEGVRLVIPPGALSSAVTVTVSGALDGTPLPELAERVGGQLRIDPAGTALAVPAQLTLPFDADLVSQLAEAPSDVKVWLRQDAGWNIQPATASDAATVTIDLPAFTTAAAGVKIITGVTCAAASCRVPIAVIVAPVCSLCVRSLGRQTDLVTARALGLDAGAIYLQAAPQTNSLTMRRLDLATGAQGDARSIAFTAGAPSPCTNIATDTDGSVWGDVLGFGNARFKFDGSAPARFDFDVTPKGAVLTSDGTLVRLTATRQGQVATRAGKNGVFGASTPLSFTGGNPLPTDPPTLQRAVAPVGGTSSQLWLVTENRAQLMDPVTGHFYSLALRRFAAGSGQQLELLQVLQGRSLTAVTAFDDGSVAALVIPSSGSSASVVVRRAPGQPLATVPSLPPICALSYDTQGGLWLGECLTPELLYITRDDQLIAVPLATAGTPEYNTRLPRTVLAEKDGTVVVITNGNEILHTRY